MSDDSSQPRKPLMRPKTVDSWIGMAKDVVLILVFIAGFALGKGWIAPDEAAEVLEHALTQDDNQYDDGW